ncbi:hypothetical protein [Duganella sp. HH101]|uniref:hypothetical protein n=1 Tax=Duganella sp. HH101 TaxID=1781066 RepID=UPI0008746B36|nr:hypothetical protein [Duganella sp. HH101]
MIVALTGMDGNGAVSDLAEDLAMLRVAAGSRVLLVSPNPGAYDPQLYDDLVIDASRRDADAGGASDDDPLARAAVIVALVRPAEIEQGHYAAFLARLRQAQEANPCARVLVTVAHGSEPLTPHQTGCLLVFVAQIPGARLADTLELDQRGTYHSHHSELEQGSRKTAYVLCAPEVRHLYSEVFRGRAVRAYS